MSAQNTPITFNGGHIYIQDSPPVDIGEIVKAGFSGIKRNFTDTTVTSNAGAYESALPTTMACGEFSFELNFIPGSAAQQELVTARDAGTLKSFKVSLSDASYWTFAAFVEAVDVVSLEVKKQVGLNGKLKLQGAATFTPAA